MADRSEDVPAHRPPFLARVDKRDLRPFTGMTRRWFVGVEWKPQDCWLGVFWKRDHPMSLDVWVCLLPMVPIHFGWVAQVDGIGGER